MNSGRENEEKQETGSLTSEKTVGELLLEARLEDGRSIPELSRITRIPEKALKYLETDNFDMLPAPVYVLGFLRSYAAELGMDVDYILSKYQVISGHTHRSRGDRWEETEIEEQPQFDYRTLVKKFSIPLAIVAAIIATAIVVLNREEVDVKPPSAIPQAEEFVDGEIAEERIDEDPAEGEGGVSSEPGGRDPGAEAPSASGTRQAEPLLLRLRATEADSTWFDIISISSGAEGEDTVYHEFILFPGTVRTLEAEKAFILRTIGNAGGFTAEFNGRELPVFGDRHEIMRNIYLGRDSSSIDTE